ncbi:hypothetical protein D3C84_619850 [compost metagenome]
MSAQVENADADLRILAVEFADHCRQEIEGCGGNAGQRHLPRLPLGQLLNSQDRPFEIVQQALRLGQKVATYRGQADAAGGSIEQLGAQPLLQLLHTPGQRGL